MLLTAVFLTLSLLHVAWALGLRTGPAVVPSRAGKPLFTPSRAATLTVAALLAAAAAVAWVRWAPGLYALALLFSLRAVGDFRYVGFFKRVRDTRFAWWDTRVYSPLCLLIAWLAACRI